VSYTADLHIHSRYAYATSSALTLENLAVWAKLKGIDLLAAGDFTHPGWFQELQEKLEPAEQGLYLYKGVKFVLGTEISCVYSQGQRQRRVHLLLFAPGLEAVTRLNRRLAAHGNLASDGRPTIARSARDIAALALDTDLDCILIPAHAWTPWYGVYGSKSGFDSLEDCFLDLTPQVRAVETGLSSDPAMNWLVPELRDRTIVSFSDAHSLPKLGRELTVFPGQPGYTALREALEFNRVEYTVEFYPEEGKYHFDGHRACGVRQSPEESSINGGRCPQCHRPLTLGVAHRTAALSRGKSHWAKDAAGFTSAGDGRPPFIRLVPLQEIIAQALGQAETSRRVQKEYHRLISVLGNELHILVKASPADLAAAAGEHMAQGILHARRGEVETEPGFDGKYGRVLVYPQDLGTSRQGRG